MRLRGNGSSSIPLGLHRTTIDCCGMPAEGAEVFDAWWLWRWWLAIVRGPRRFSQNGRGCDVGIDYPYLGIKMRSNQKAAGAWNMGLTRMLLSSPAVASL